MYPEEINTLEFKRIKHLQLFNKLTKDSTYKTDADFICIFQFDTKIITKKIIAK